MRRAMTTLLLVASVAVAANAHAADPDLGTPRAALRFFVDSSRARDFTAAAKALDLRYFPPSEWGITGPRLARQLVLVLDGERWFDWENAAEQAVGNPADSAGSVMVGKIPLGADPVSFSLTRGPDGAWRIDSSVVAAIPRLYAAHGPGWLGERLPALLTGTRFLDLAAWHWLGLGAALALALFVSLVLGALGKRLAVRIARRTRVTWDDKLVEAAAGPTQLVLGLIIFAAAARGVHLPIATQSGLGLPLRIGAVIAFCWGALRAIGFAAEMLAGKLQQGEGATARSHLTQIALLRRIVGLVVVILGCALILLQFEALRALGTSLIASAGVAGIVIGLAAQRPIATLLAGLQVSLAQPVRIGDVVVMEGEWGTVEELTLTCVVVKVWDQRRLVVPITKVLDAPFQNWTRSGSDLLGTAFLHADYRVPVDAVRRELERFVADRPEWDGKTVSLQVTNASERDIEMRAVVSSPTATRCWDLRCAVREHLVSFLQKLDDGAYLPRIRLESPPPGPERGDRIKT